MTEHECLRATHDSENCQGAITARATEATAQEENPTYVWECHWHMEQSLNRNEEIRRTYGSQTPPPWFDPSAAGEVWHEDDY